MNSNMRPLYENNQLLVMHPYKTFNNAKHRIKIMNAHQFRGRVGQTVSFEYTRGSGGVRVVKLQKVQYDAVEGLDYSCGCEFRRFLTEGIVGKVKVLAKANDMVLTCKDLIDQYGLPADTSITEAYYVANIFNRSSCIKLFPKEGIVVIESAEIADSIQIVAVEEGNFHLTFTVNDAKLIFCLRDGMAYYGGRPIETVTDFVNRLDMFLGEHNGATS